METGEPLDKIGGRKFIFAILLIVIGYLLVDKGKLTADSFLNYAEFVGATYVIGNVAVKVTDALKGP
jgi:hypothetical protein